MNLILCNGYEKYIMVKVKYFTCPICIKRTKKLYRKKCLECRTQGCIGCIQHLCQVVDTDMCQKFIRNHEISWITN